MIRTAILGAVVLSFLSSQGLAQKPYWNQTWNFCVNGPPGWTPHHSTDEYGIEFMRGAVSMSFGATVDNEGLDDNFQAAYLSDNTAKVSGRQKTHFRGREAITATLTSPHKMQHVLIVSGEPEDVIYELQLTAPDRPTLEKFLPTFNAEVQSFRFDCR